MKKWKLFDKELLKVFGSVGHNTPDKAIYIGETI